MYEITTKTTPNLFKDAIWAQHGHSLTPSLQNRCYSTSGERVAKYNGTKDANVRFALPHKTPFG